MWFWRLARRIQNIVSVGGAALKLQKRLNAMVDKALATGLIAAFRACERWPDERRMRELTDPETDHSWLWAADSRKGAALAADEFVDAVRLRLGAAGATETVVCGLCGDSLEPNGAHCLLCAKGPSTRGHNRVGDEVHTLALAADPAAELEPEGLIASRPGLRPADVLTSAASSRLAALDVGIVSPDAIGAGDDCVAAMAERKRGKYAAQAGELDRVGVDYVPLVRKADGRPHDWTVAVLRAMAQRAAR